MQIFADVNLAYQSLESRMKAEGLKVRVMALFRAWEDWTIYPRDFLIRLQNTFLGLATTVSIQVIQKYYFYTVAQLWSTCESRDFHIANRSLVIRAIEHREMTLQSKMALKQPE